MILVSFCRILNGLSDGIDFFERCNSPLTVSKIWKPKYVIIGFKLFVKRILLKIFKTGEP